MFNQPGILIVDFNTCSFNMCVCVYFLWVPFSGKFSCWLGLEVSYSDITNVETPSKAVDLGISRNMVLSQLVSL